MADQSVAVFWDFENIHPAANIAGAGYDVANRIRRIAHNFGSINLFKAYLEISDRSTKSASLRSELQSAGVCLCDCPHNGGKDVADKMILVDMLAYAIDNAAPSTIVLISGDRDFVYAVSVLRQRRYKIILIAPPSTHVSLRSQASVVFDWNLAILRKNALQCPLPATDFEAKIPPSLESGRRVPNTFSPPSISSSCSSSLPSTPQLSLCDSESSFNSPFHDAIVVFTPCQGGGEEEVIPFADWTPDIGGAWENVPDVKPEATVDDMSANLDTGGQVSLSNRSESSSESLVDDLAPIITKVDGGESLVPLPSDLLPTILAPIPTPAVEQSATRAISTVNVPRRFIPLVTELERFHSEGYSRPTRSALGQKLALKYRRVYEDAGVSSFARYVDLAERAGIVTLGGMQNTAWVSLTVNEVF